MKKKKTVGQTHYFIEDYDLESDKDSFECAPLGATLTFHTDAGVFSKKHLDKASELLIETVAKEEQAFAAALDEDETFSLVDLGTGYGPILIALAKHFRQFTGLGIEVNRRALDLAHRNVRGNKLSGRVQLMGRDVTTFLSRDGEPRACDTDDAEGVSHNSDASHEGNVSHPCDADDAKTILHETNSNETNLNETNPNETNPNEEGGRLCFASHDIVVTNPPIRAGKDVVYGFFAAAQQLLKEGGRFYAVISKNQGAKSSAAHLESLFSEVNVIAKKGEFRVIRAVKRK